MQYSLYELYSQSSLDLYAIRKHFLDNFYYQDHSRNDARKVLRTIVSSSKIDKLLAESYNRQIVPSYMDFLSTINSMLKFIFRSNDTQILAILDAVLRWDIEVNSKLHLISLSECKDNILRIFQKYQTYKEIPNDSSVSDLSSLSSKENTKPRRLPKLKTWSIEDFKEEFGDMKVGEYVNNDTGETFHSCVFTNGYTRTFVNFSSKLGELTPEEIEERKDDLVIVKLPTGSYSLAKNGKSNLRDVNI